MGLIACACGRILLNSAGLAGNLNLRLQILAGTNFSEFSKWDLAARVCDYSFCTQCALLFSTQPLHSTFLHLYIYQSMLSLQELSLLHIALCLMLFPFFSCGVLPRLEACMWFTKSTMIAIMTIAMVIAMATTMTLQNGHFCHGSGSKVWVYVWVAMVSGHVCLQVVTRGSQCLCLLCICDQIKYMAYNDIYHAPLYFVNYIQILIRPMTSEYKQRGEVVWVMWDYLNYC